MGPMGPMGQGMQGMSTWMGGWGAAMMGFAPLLAIVLLLAIAAVLVAVIRLRVSEGPQTARRSPEEVLRERYAGGEIGWNEFRAGLLNLLRSRYIRGELTTDEYEARVEHLLGVRRRGGSARESARPSDPPDASPGPMAADAAGRAAAAGHEGEARHG